MSTNIFVYGVLQYDELVQQLTGNTFQKVSAELLNHQRLTLHMEGWSDLGVVIPSPDSLVQGTILLEVDDAALAVLDDFEEADTGLYMRKLAIIRLENGQEAQVSVYAGTQKAREHLDGEWDEQAFVSKHYATYKDEIIPKFLKERALRLAEQSDAEE
ncbi:gamma-glutamylcyclotransferase family protein [Aliamphritea ceti]|uniref:gamma-glutamylcyclotransferase family protein n=1 Tax=Aliamphritea ceti TaxID=1524258 RepID=UPI0021C2B33D|nr:gamma-glutamylcyclotransferase family protein [Aliamphritea ceti]